MLASLDQAVVQILDRSRNWGLGEVRRGWEALGSASALIRASVLLMAQRRRRVPP